ncbi:hypothetical protein VM1G_09459 [Cytospora mali]|uniref:Uncharacterized protein n=1 Tax=Cytospora mali TaxID=578113 RepID=A0A194WB76_CYTMA|nr:hypothetical protein VM1G_09459 [Valsa mali]
MSVHRPMANTVKSYHDVRSGHRHPLPHIRNPLRFYRDMDHLHYGHYNHDPTKFRPVAELDNASGRFSRFESYEHGLVGESADDQTFHGGSSHHLSTLTLSLQPAAQSSAAQSSAYQVSRPAVPGAAVWGYF